MKRGVFVSKRVKKAKEQIERAQEALDMPAWLWSACTIELAGNREAVLSGPVEILEYDERTMLVKLGEKRVRISGKEVAISCLSTDGVKITGEIDSIEFVKAG